MTNTKIAAEQLGAIAYRIGKSYWDNAFDITTQKELFESWCAGWREEHIKEFGYFDISNIKKTMKRHYF